jgi:hypothetical protein
MGSDGAANLGLRALDTRQLLGNREGQAAPGRAGLADGGADLARGWLSRLLLQGLVPCADGRNPWRHHGSLRIRTVGATEPAPPGTMVTFLGRQQQ